MNRVAIIWGIYWRFLVVTILLMVCLALVHGSVGLFDRIAKVNYQPTVFWLSMAGIFWLASTIKHNGLLSIFWGRILCLPALLWQKLSVSISLFFVVLAIIALLVYLSSNSDVWAFYKLWVQPLLLLCAPLGLIVRLVDKQ